MSGKNGYLPRGSAECIHVLAIHFSGRVRLRAMRFNFAVACLLIAAIAAGQAVQSSIPVSLTDDEFWKLVSEASEPGGIFQDENYVSNELRYQEVLPWLQQSIERGGVYIGVGPEQNFTYIAAIQPGISFVLDIRRQNAMELLLYKAFFESSNDRSDFLSRLFCRARPANLSTTPSVDELFTAFGRVPASETLFKENLATTIKALVERHHFSLEPGDEESIAKVYRAFCDSGTTINYQFRNTPGSNPNYMRLMTATDSQRRNWSFLASEENFRRVQDLERKNLIVPVVGDFAGPKALRALGDFVRAHGAVVDVFYVSNVEQYLFENGTWKKFYDSVATLPINSHSTFIRTVAPGEWRPCGTALQAPPLMLPLHNAIADFNLAYSKGQIQNQCDMISRAR